MGLCVVRSSWKKPHSHTCIPEGLMMSKAPMVLKTNCTTLLKLSSPILQEPSMRKTTSAFAPLQTAHEKKPVKSPQLGLNISFKFSHFSYETKQTEKQQLKTINSGDEEFLFCFFKQLAEYPALYGQFAIFCIISPRP